MFLLLELSLDNSDINKSRCYKGLLILNDKLLLFNYINGTGVWWKTFLKGENYGMPLK